jgi:hypothetical protein
MSTIFVLTVNGRPDCYFDDKSDALDYMRERAHEMCLPSPFGLGQSHSVVRHHSDERVDIVTRLNNVLISYDQTACSLQVSEIRGLKKIYVNK